jgi:bla regulator protein blaR1
MIRRLLLLFAMAAYAMAGPAFDVASVKPSDPANRRMYLDSLSGGRLTARSVSLSWLVQFAYHLESYQISGGPGWMVTSRYDVMARAEDSTTGEDRIRQMAQTLLADRFALKVHTESRELPIYRMVTVKAGKELHKVAACAAPECPVFEMSIGGQLTARGATMEDFTHAMTDLTGRPVRNQTGLAGQYDFRLSWTPDDATPGAVGPRGSPAPDPTLASVFTALTEQLGLKLQSDKGPVDVYVIDHAEKASEN